MFAAQLITFHLNWSAIGLLFDIIGATIVFINGLPSYTPPPSIHLENAIHSNKAAKKRKWSYWGLGLIITGFILQLIGALVPYNI